MLAPTLHSSIARTFKVKAVDWPHIVFELSTAGAAHIRT